MSNPSLPIPPAAAAQVFGNAEDVDGDRLDEGETTDSEATVEQDIREAADSADKLEE